LEIIEIGQTPIVVNTQFGKTKEGHSTAVNANLLAQIPPKHHVVTIPLEVQEIPSQIEALKTRLRKNKTEKILISMHGIRIQHPLIAELGEALPGKEFGISGKVINLFKA
jgi:hypothetical protein